MLNLLSQLWTGLDRRAKATIILTLALCAAGLFALLHFGSGLDMTPLYTGLAPEDAAQIVEKLKAERVPYKLSEGGNTISVPQAKVYEMRIALAKEGLPASGQVGFEVFDRSSLPGTEFSNQVNYQRALQGELARTITAIDGVRSARVHIVLPEESLFADKTKASVAVVVQPVSGRELSPEATAAIAQLVGSSVRDVPASEVTVVDTTGRVLHGPELGGNSGALAGTQLQVRQHYEERVARSLQSMLDAVLGPNKSVVRVQAVLDFDTQEVRTEAVMPGVGGKGLVTTEKVKAEKYQGGREGTGGTAGLANNLGAPGVAIRQGSNGTYTQHDETREYQYSRNSTSTVKAPGRVKSLSVAAIIDEALPGTAETQVKQLLGTASGVNTARGDIVTVQRMKISAAEAAKTQEDALAKQERGQRSGSFWRTALRSSMGLIAAVILFFTVLTILRQLRGVTLVAAPSGDEWSGSEPSPEAAERGRPGTARGGPAVREPAVSPAEMRERLREITIQDADAVADRLQAMLRQDQPTTRP
jgi:flagellar M-ring protein FliF